VSKLLWEDQPISLHGVPFEEALAGVLAVKPPEAQDGDRPKRKSGRKKKPTAQKESTET